MDTVDGLYRLGRVGDPPGPGGWLPARVRWHPVLRLIRDFLSPVFHPDPGQRHDPVPPPGRHPGLGRPGPGRRVPTAPGVRHAAGWPPQAGLRVLAASARWLAPWAPRIAPWGITCLGDGHQPFCQQVLAQGSHFLFVCLPQSHPARYAWLADFERTAAVPTQVTTRWTGHPTAHRYLSLLPSSAVARPQ